MIGAQHPLWGCWLEFCTYTATEALAGYSHRSLAGVEVGEEGCRWLMSGMWIPVGWKSMKTLWGSEAAVVAIGAFCVENFGVLFIISHWGLQLILLHCWYWKPHVLFPCFTLSLHLNFTDLWIGKQNKTKKVSLLYGVLKGWETPFSLPWGEKLF